MTESSIDDRALIDRARAYVEGSNGHDAERIRPMLANDALYRSSDVGVHQGADAILARTGAFFAAHPDVHWEATNYRLIAQGGVEFDFVITLGGTQSPGTERLFFDAAGLIRRIEVER